MEKDFIVYINIDRCNEQQQRDLIKKCEEQNQPYELRHLGDSFWGYTLLSKAQEV